MLSALVKNSGLDALLNATISVDGARKFKPHPDCYALVEKTLGLKNDEVMFVSSNGFDVAGAKHFGFKVAWIRRGGSTPLLAVVVDRLLGNDAASRRSGGPDDSICFLSFDERRVAPSQADVRFSNRRRQSGYPAKSPRRSRGDQRLHIWYATMIGPMGIFSSLGSGCWASETGQSLQDHHGKMTRGARLIGTSLRVPGSHHCFWREHLCPVDRAAQRFGKIVAIPVLAGLHHQYVRM
jgi:hypothetical protein